MGGRGVTGWVLYGCLVLGFASALVAGVFQSFSDFVMAGLARARPAGGIESMQQLNRTVYRSVFLAMLLLLVPLTIGFALFVVSTYDGSASALVIAASALYVTTVFGVTAIGNVPMNKQLDAMNADSEEAATYWLTYVQRWTALNHVRTLGAAATAVLFLAATVAIKM